MERNGERVMNSLANRIMDLDGVIEKRNKEREEALECTDTYEFVEKMRNTNTVRKTNSDVNKFSTWLKSRNETRNIEELSAPELDVQLANFFMTAVKNDGSEFEPDTLKSIQASINRFLKQKGYLVDLIEGPQFSHSREVLASKRKLLRQQGKGNRLKQADLITPDEINILYEKNLLGKGNATALINTVYMNNTMHFGMRSREEHANLRWGDVELKSTATGDRYLEFIERATKTRNGVIGGARAFTPKMYESKGNPRCPVSVYLYYLEKRPASMMKDDDPFYLGVNKKMSQSWYIAQPMGKNYLGALIKTMCEEAGIQGRKVNHSARKTAITTLVHAGVPPTLVQQHSGHKNLASINNYSKASEKQQQTMSSIICNYSSATVESTSATTNVSVVDGDCGIPDDGVDDLLCHSSQEMVESILKEIDHVEQVSDGSGSFKYNTNLGSVPFRPLQNTGMFNGATINGNIIFNNYSGDNKRKRIRVIDSDSD